jgi:hypothetical protein
MRLSSWVVRTRQGSNVIQMPLPPDTDHKDELTAFRGLLVAFTASALLWSIGLAAAWLLLSRN